MSRVSLAQLGESARDGRLRFALLLAFMIAFGIYKACLIGFGQPAALGLDCLFDASFWALCWLLSELVAGRCSPWRERAAGALLYPLLYASGALVFAHTWFYESAIERRLTAMDVSASGIAGFFHELPRSGHYALAVLVLGLHALALVLAAVLERPRLARALGVVSALCLASGLWALRAPITPSVVFDTGHGLWQFASLPRVRATPVAAAVQQRNMLDKSAPAALPAPRFKKVIVLVMETMTSARVARELSGVPAHSFFRAREHVHEYTRYFSNNQDSRTGMLSMLASRVLPYEAYNEADVEAYTGLVRTETLIERMRRLGFRSAFVLSQVVPEEIVRDLKWDEIVHLREDEIPQLSKQYLCLEPDVWENSCEDVAVIPRMLDFLQQSERAFAYQEFMWGHASEYNQLSGKSNAVFYSNYVDMLIAGLAQRGMLEDSLIAITSDHGFRAQALQSEQSALKIPLMFYAARFTSRSDARLLSHVDFKDLLFDELSETATFSTPNQHVFIQGPTGSGMALAISERGVLTLLKERAGARLLLSREPAEQAVELAPGQILYLWERHKQHFDRALRSARSEASQM